MPHPFIKINQHFIGAGHPVYVIAEAGINHNGDIKITKEMISRARQCGADAIKFQILTPERCYTRQSISLEIFKKVSFSKDQWHSIFDFALQEGIDCFATFVDMKDIEDYKDLDCPAFKVSSSNATNIPLLEYIATQGRPVILSSGLCDMQEVREAVHCLRTHGQRELALLQCTAIYPAPAEAVNLNVLRTFSQEFPDCPIGFSDHTDGIECAVASVAMGAVIIEKHFTLDKLMPGPDQLFSADPRELTALVQGVRTVERALGSAVKVPVLSEVQDRVALQRTIVAAVDLKKGEVLGARHLALKRFPGGGLKPKDYQHLLNKRLKCNIAMDQPVSFNEVE